MPGRRSSVEAESKLTRVARWKSEESRRRRRQRRRGGRAQQEKVRGSWSKDEREVRAARKTGQFGDNRGASDGRLSGVWRRRDASRAARHSRRDNESSLPCWLLSFLPFPPPRLSSAPSPFLSRSHCSQSPPFVVRFVVPWTRSAAKTTRKKRDLPERRDANRRRRRSAAAVELATPTPCGVALHPAAPGVPSRVACVGFHRRTRMHPLVGYARGYIKSGWM